MNLKSFYFFILSFLSLFVLGEKAFASETTIIDISKVESDTFYTNLNGNWTFFEQALLMPNEVNGRKGTTVSIPSSFLNQTGDVNTFGTYTTTIKIPERYIGQSLAIYIPYEYSAYTLFVNNIELLSNGTVGTNSITHQAEMAPKAGYFMPDSTEVQLTLQLSSFAHIRGGFENPIYIGEVAALSRTVSIDLMINLFLIGAIFIISLFMLLLAFYSRGTTIFIFALFTALIAIRSLFAVPFYYTILFPFISWETGTQLEYILTTATSMFYVMLLWKWHEQEFSKKVMYFLVVIHLSLIIIISFTQPVFFQDLFFKVFTLTIPTFFYLLYVVYRSIRRNNYIAKVNAIGTFLIFFAFFNDYAIGNNWYDGVEIMLPAIGLYIMIHVVVLSRDFAHSIRKIHQQNEHLSVLNKSNEQLATQLQKEMKQKDNFLANTSHELRNPLHGIINITQSILQNAKAPLNNEFMEDLKLQLTIARHMARTLDDLLDITRLKEHRIQLNKKAVNLQATVVGVVDMLNVLIEQKNVRIDVHIANDFPNVAADSNRLIQILFNLLHNAIKYTHEGSITIEAETKDDIAHIHVKDTGIGIQPELLPVIFSPYEQGDSSMTSIGGGLGLGLNICQQLVHMQNGTISVSSIVGQGSIFTFTLPLADDTLQEETNLTLTPTMDAKYLTTADNSFLSHTPMQSSSTTEGFLVNKPKILIVDDDAVNLKILVNVLSKENYEMTTVTSGHEALYQLKKEKWDLVISDVMMPNMSGYELTHAIREHYALSELPIILLTARSNVEDIYAGFVAGANDYVTKPVEALELRARVHALTALQASIRDRLGVEAAWLQAQLRPHFILNTINAIISLSEIDFQKMLTLLDQFSYYLQSSFQLKNVHQTIPISSELELLKSYLYIEQTRFEDRLHIVWDADDLEDSVMIPPLVLQTLVENAINHGILEKVSGGTVTIRIHSKELGTEISIIDDGVGMSEGQVQSLFNISPSEQRGIGLLNTEQRLQRLYGKGLSITSKLNEGTTVSFTLPN
ncbi:ATP-binding protein [Lysinibacillus louembei]|uniref:histidine kinase n=1 Tax=Lysinibacillus louembei TaxID=1470088 RepID=A0ABZ0RZV4_9BACI|nr:ATP-binding protein [Lysinibacillus louembei]WPK13782.1 ATP-binding protein [Lysinibacillus louembei]